MLKGLFRYIERILIIVCAFATIAAATVLYHSYNESSKGEQVSMNILEASVPTTRPRVAAKALEPSAKTEQIGIIVLDESNSVAMDAVYDENSVQEVMRALQKISDKSVKGSTIYLVMNTPGGSVDSGIRLINFAKALPNKIKTLTIFAASMGFMTVQQLDERLILAGGTLMSHPASFSLQGETPYQVSSRLKYITSIISGLSQVSADRMKLSLSDYENLVHDEYWAYDDNAVRERAADRKVLAKCGSYAEKTKWKTIDTMIGSFQIELSSCPLIPGYISIRLPKDATEEVLTYVKLMFSERPKFTKEYIINNKYLDFQK